MVVNKQKQAFSLKSHEKLPLKGVLALGSEVVDVRLEVELEHVVLVDVLRLGGDGDRVAQQGEAGQRVVILSTGRGHRGQDRVNHEILPPSTYPAPHRLVVLICVTALGSSPGGTCRRRG